MVDPPLSLAALPVYSHGNTGRHHHLKHYTWSDGKPVTSRDVGFWINLLRANKVNWGEYAPGLFPDDVRSGDPVARPGRAHTERPVQPALVHLDQLTQITPLPLHAWDKTSATGKVGNYDTSTAGARAVFKFLTAQSKDSATYGSNPLWKTVDGPWKLVSYQPAASEVRREPGATPGR